MGCGCGGENQEGYTHLMDEAGEDDKGKKKTWVLPLVILTGVAIAGMVAIGTFVARPKWYYYASWAAVVLFVGVRVSKKNKNKK